jgi:hypothetical protein
MYRRGGEKETKRRKGRRGREEGERKRKRKRERERERERDRGEMLVFLIFWEKGIMLSLLC